MSSVLANFLWGILLLGQLHGKIQQDVGKENATDGKGYEFVIFQNVTSLK